MSQDLLLPLQVQEVGKIPIVIEAKYSGQKIIRSFELVSRSSVYPSVRASGDWLEKITGLVEVLQMSQVCFWTK